MRRWLDNLVLVLGGALLAASTAHAAVVINEVDYDQPVGFDTAEFIELKNTGPAPVNLAGWSLEFVNGTVGIPATYQTVTLTTGTIAPGGYFVVSFGSAYPWYSDLQFNLIDSSVQNGPADAIALHDASGAIVDALSYSGNCGAPWTEGAGTLLDDDNITLNLGMSRSPDGADSNDNAADFALRCITPGAPNSGSTGGCGLPVPTSHRSWGAVKSHYR